MIDVIREYPCNVKETVKKVREEGKTKLAIANKGIMFNVLEFYKECINHNIQPVLGCEFPLENGKSITLFVKNNEGYHSLMKLSTIACSITGSYTNPTLPSEYLNFFSYGLTENPEDVENFEIEFPGPELPEVDYGAFDSNFAFELEVAKGFNDLLNKGKIPSESKEYTERLFYELSVIKKINFSSYFLIVRDYVKWARDNGCGPCIVRGSASCSLVLYCLGLSDIDPIKNNLAFERFINPQRLMLPDIDIEVPVGCRDKIYKHLEEKYGKEKVGYVASFSRDGEYIGCNPHEIIVSIKRLAEYVPVFINENGKLASQYSKFDLESCGLVKFDIFESADLSVLQGAEKEIEGLKLNEIPLDDKETYEMIGKGNFAHISIKYSLGAKKSLALFNPENIDDLAIMCSLDRPSGWDVMSIIIDNKIKNNPCESKIECLKPILEPTYGCFVFEEQFIEAVHEFAGWDRGKANLFRKILAQRRKNLIPEYEKQFIEDGMKNGHSEQECKDLIHDFDFYISSLFLKSYALEIATVIYKLSYIKCHYPQIFENLANKYKKFNTELLNICEGEYMHDFPDCSVRNERTSEVGELINMRVMGPNADERAIKANKSDAPFMLATKKNHMSKYKYQPYWNVSEIFKDGWHAAKGW